MHSPDPASKPTRRGPPHRNATHPPAQCEAAAVSVPLAGDDLALLRGLLVDRIAHLDRSIESMSYPPRIAAQWVDSCARQVERRAAVVRLYMQFGGDDEGLEALLLERQNAPFAFLRPWPLTACDAALSERSNPRAPDAAIAAPAQSTAPLQSSRTHPQSRPSFRSIAAAIRRRLGAKQ